jgi:hypothetical protein
MSVLSDVKSGVSFMQLSSKKRKGLELEAVAAEVPVAASR